MRTLCTSAEGWAPTKSTLNAPVEDPKASRTPGGGVEPEGSTPRQGVEEPRGEVDVEPSPKKIPICLVQTVCVCVCVLEEG